MGDALKKALLVGLMLIVCVGILGCWMSKSTAKEPETPVPEPETQRAWGEATVDHIMTGEPTEEETEK